MRDLQGRVAVDVGVAVRPGTWVLVAVAVGVAVDGRGAETLPQAGRPASTVLRGGARTQHLYGLQFLSAGG